MNIIMHTRCMNRHTKTDMKDGLRNGRTDRLSTAMVVLYCKTESKEAAVVDGWLDEFIMAFFSNVFCSALLSLHNDKNNDDDDERQT